MKTTKILLLETGNIEQLITGKTQTHLLLKLKQEVSILEILSKNSEKLGSNFIQNNTTHIATIPTCKMGDFEIAVTNVKLNIEKIKFKYTDSIGKLYLPS